MFNANSIRNEVICYLDSFAEWYDVDGIVDELGNYYVNGEHIQTIDEVDPDEFQDLLRKYDEFMG